MLCGTTLAIVTYALVSTHVHFMPRTKGKCVRTGITDSWGKLLTYFSANTRYVRKAFPTFDLRTMWCVIRGGTQMQCRMQLYFMYSALSCINVPWDHSMGRDGYAQNATSNTDNDGCSNGNKNAHSGNFFHTANALSEFGNQAIPPSTRLVSERQPRTPPGVSINIIFGQYLYSILTLISRPSKLLTRSFSRRQFSASMYS